MAVLPGGAAWGQARLSLYFLPRYNGQMVHLDTVLHTDAGPLTVTGLRFYVSAVRLTQKGRPVWSEPASYHLVDAADTASLRLALAAPAGLVYDSVAFCLGIDSATNARGAQGGALDATRGMYWAWHSGYINLKLEGTSPRCATRKNQFTYHLGGYRPGEYALQTVRLAARPGRRIVCDVDLAYLLETIDLAAEPTVMSPGGRGVALSAAAAEMFSLTAP